MNILIDGPSWIGSRAFESLYAADIRAHMFKSGVRFHVFIDGDFNTHVRAFLGKHAPRTSCVYYAARHYESDKTNDLRAEGGSLVYVDGDLVSGRKEFLRVVGALSPTVIEHWPVLNKMSDVWNVEKATMLGVLVTQQQFNLFDMCTGASTVKLSSACLKEISEAIERDLGIDDDTVGDQRQDAEAPFEHDNVPVGSGASNRLKRRRPGDRFVVQKSFVARDESSIETIDDDGDDDDSHDGEDDDDIDDASFNPPEKVAKTNGDSVAVKRPSKVLISVDDDDGNNEEAAAEPLTSSVVTRGVADLDSNLAELEQYIHKDWLEPALVGVPVQPTQEHPDFYLMIQKRMAAWNTTIYGKRLATLLEAMWNNIGPTGKTKLRTSLRNLATLGRVYVSRQTAKDRLRLGKTSHCVLCGKTTHETKMLVHVNLDGLPESYKKEIAHIDPSTGAMAPIPCGQCCGQRAETLAKLQRMLATARLDVLVDSDGMFRQRAGEYAEKIDTLLTNAIKANGYKE